MCSTWLQCYFRSSQGDARHTCSQIFFWAERGCSDHKATCNATRGWLIYDSLGLRRTWSFNGWGEGKGEMCVMSGMSIRTEGLRGGPNCRLRKRTEERIQSHYWSHLIVESLSYPYSCIKRQWCQSSGLFRSRSCRYPASLIAERPTRLQTRKATRQVELEAVALVCSRRQAKHEVDLSLYVTPQLVLVISTS